MAVVALVSGGSVACAALLGVDFDGRLEDARMEGGPEDAARTDASEGGGPVDGSDAVSVDRAWSYWPITSSFPSNQTEKKGSTIFDNVTGLAWADATVGPVGFSGAPAACAALELDGYADWRVPTRIELVSLVNYRFVPAVSADLIEPATETWTSSTYVDDSSQGWVVAFLSGATTSRPKTTLTRVRCVRAGNVPENPNNAPPDRFVVTGDAVVYDVQTGRNWQKHPSVLQTFAEATAYCASLTLNGAGGFRLPEVHELHTIVDERRARPALDTTFEKAGLTGLTWSKTARANSSDTVWTVEEYDGHTVIYGVDDKAFARCVR